MRFAALVATVAFASHASADVQFSGYLQEHYVRRFSSDADCGLVRSCRTLANEQRVQVLAEGRFDAGLAATARLDAYRDAAIDRSDVEARELFAEMPLGQSASVRAGRQILTWGVSDYLFVNDIFPKNYDAFFLGRSVDYLKRPIDAVKLNASAFSAEAEVVIAKPEPDIMPRSARFIGAARAGADRVPERSEGTDVALKLSRRIGRWDSATYLARYHSRELSVRPNAEGLHREAPIVNHLGASLTGNVASGVGWVELAYLDSHPGSQNFNRFVFGPRIKSLVGYSREIARDTTVTLQWQLERDLHRSVYLGSLNASAEPAERNRHVAHVRVHSRMRNQTIGLGFQAFVTSEGDSYVNPFASYAAHDALNFEFGANVFHGSQRTRYGALRDDSNVYFAVRYSY